MREYRQAWREKNREKIKAQAEIYRKANREKINSYNRDWHAKNSKYRTKYINACRKPRVKMATPSWADTKAIRDFYLNCPEGYHVDHIIPLNGKLVCGLHILGNLQYLSATENLRKGNKVCLI